MSNSFQSHTDCKCQWHSMRAPVLTLATLYISCLFSFRFSRMCGIVTWLCIFLMMREVKCSLYMFIFLVGILLCNMPVIVYFTWSYCCFYHWFVDVSSYILDVVFFILLILFYYNFLFFLFSYKCLDKVFHLNYSELINFFF